MNVMVSLSATPMAHPPRSNPCAPSADELWDQIDREDPD
jgi:hypothetical protein